MRSALMEQWLPVVGWEAYYEVSDHGHVRTVARRITAKDGRSWWKPAHPLRPFRSSKMGYWTLVLHADGRTGHLRVHNMMLEAFVGPRPPRLVGCHNDGDVDHNVISNLRWDTQKSNIQDTLRHGTHYWANKTHCKRNHEFTPANTYINPTSGARQCRQCVSDTAKARHAARTTQAA